RLLRGLDTPIALAPRPYGETLSEGEVAVGRLLPTVLRRLALSYPALGRRGKRYNKVAEPVAVLPLLLVYYLDIPVLVVRPIPY
ncbi:hypothetical protein EJ08DRAFT_703818, partial [Tothia fuscella]